MPALAAGLLIPGLRRPVGGAADLDETLYVLLPVGPIMQFGVKYAF